MNFKLTVQYDGTDFHGWQTQSSLRTVQSELERALSLIDGRDVVVNGSGRTDAGVHAEGQVANVRIHRDISPEKLRAAINANVPADLRVIEAVATDDEFHARYSAREKTYTYRIVNGPVISPFWNRFALLESRPLNLESMRNISTLFVGTHDWTAFSAAQTESENRIRTVTQLTITEHDDSRAPGRMIEMTITAAGFLRYMVRSIAGTLIAAGRSEVVNDTVIEALERGNRSIVAATAPAHGLSLLSVRYD